MPLDSVDDIQTAPHLVAVVEVGAVFHVCAGIRKHHSLTAVPDTPVDLFLVELPADKRKMLVYGFLQVGRAQADKFFRQHETFIQ